MQLNRGTALTMRRRGVSEVIAVLLLVVVVVAVVGVVVLFGTGVIHSLIAGGVATPMTGSGQMFVGGSTGTTAVLTLTLRDSESQPISAISVTCPNWFLSCVTMDYLNNPISAAAPVPPDGTSVGSATVTTTEATAFQAGTTYSILLAVSFKGGGETTIDVSVTAVS